MLIAANIAVHGLPGVPVLAVIQAVLIVSAASHLLLDSIVTLTCYCLRGLLQTVRHCK